MITVAINYYSYSILFYRSTDDEIGIISLIVVSIRITILIVLILTTERELKKTFTENCIRK